MIYREDYETGQDYVNALIRQRRNRFRLIIAVVIAIVAAVLIFLLTYYRVRNVQVTGNTRYTNEEITEMVTGSFLADNSLYLSLTYHSRQITNVPFIEQMDVTVLSHDSIRITVYEKSLAGYVEYLGTNFYFGRDGTVVESSKDVVDGVPRILGLSFDHVVLYEQLPVENTEIFGRILNVTQLLSKYDLTADSIYFDDGLNMTIYFGDVKVAMGGNDYTDEKLSNVAQILPSLDGRGEGTLEMENYTPSTKYITYVVKDGKSSQVASSEAGTGTASDMATAAAIASSPVAASSANTDAQTSEQTQTATDETTQTADTSQTDADTSAETAGDGAGAGDDGASEEGTQTAAEQAPPEETTPAEESATTGPEIPAEAVEVTE